MIFTNIPNNSNNDNDNNNDDDNNHTTTNDDAWLPGSPGPVPVALGVGSRRGGCCQLCRSGGGHGLRFRPAVAWCLGGERLLS